MDSPRTSTRCYNSECIEVGEYRKANHSMNGGNCVEIGGYRKASRSINNGQCVEIGSAGAVIGVRDTRQKDQADRTELRFTGVQWGRFIRSLKAG